MEIFNPIMSAVSSFLNIYERLPSPITALIGLAVVFFLVDFILNLIPR